MPDHSVLVSDPTGAPNVAEVDKSLNEVSSPNDTDLVGRRRTVEQKEVKRDYSNVKQVVVDHYRNLRSKQTHAHVLKMHEKFKTRERRPLKIWEALEIMSTIVDTSDPDISLPNLEHLYQTAEGLREEGAERWMILAGLMHDLGKVMFFWDVEEDGTSIGTQWSVTGDSFVTGCAFPEGNGCIFPEFNQLNPDWNDSRYNTKYGVYEPNCGMNKTYCSWGHDEYLYQVLVEEENAKLHTLPPEALYIIRFHSCYPWHSHSSYEYLEDDFDKQMKPIVKQFQKHDLYTKKDVPTDVPSLEEYYRELVAEFFGDNTLQF